MFCPVCKTEYREGFMRCSDCGAALVASLPAASDLDPGSAEVMWAGTDPSTYTVITAALQEADIPYEDNARSSLISSSWTRSPYEIWIYKRDHDAAQRALASLHAEPSPESTAEQHEEHGDNRGLAQELPPEELLDGLPGPVADDLVENFDPDEATSEIWSGEEASMAKFLQDSLQANGIGCVIREADSSQQRILVNPLSRPSESVVPAPSVPGEESEFAEGRKSKDQHLLVNPADESRAREIIREVLEATPPE